MSYSVWRRDETALMWQSSLLLLTGGTAGGCPHPSVCLWCLQPPAAQPPQPWRTAPLHPPQSHKPKSKSIDIYFHCCWKVWWSLFGILWPTMSSTSPSLAPSSFPLPSSGFCEFWESSASSSQFWICVSAWIEVVPLRFQRERKGCQIKRHALLTAEPEGYQLISHQLLPPAQLLLLLSRRMLD